jgi:lysophospholipase L1-like esterase
MALGDGLAAGEGSGLSTDRMGYRAPLQRALSAAGVSYDMVGSDSTGNADKFDAQHEGHASYRIDQLTAKAAGWLAKNPPDLVLLSAGLEDLRDNYKIADAPARFEQLLNVVRSSAPGVKIGVSTVIDSTDSRYQPRITAFNDALRLLAAQQAAVFGDVFLVELSGLFTPGLDYSNSVRLNDSGYAKVAVEWGRGLAQVLPEASGLAAPPLRIMPLGSSVTWGLGSSKANDDAGYRGFLQRSLDAASVSYDMVGSVRRGVQDRIDTDAEGHSGYRIDQVAAGVPKWLSANPADIVLLHTGGNDVNQNYKLADAAARLSALIDSIRANAPAGVKIVVCTLLDSSRAAFQSKTAVYNESVRQVAAAQTAAHGDVWLAEMAGAIDSKIDLYDYMHPNASGYAKMAAVWSTVLAQIIPGASPLAQPATRIMALGAETAAGSHAGSATGSTGFRGPLYRSLTAAKINVDMIGSESKGNIDFADTGSEGHTGQRVAALAAKAPTWLNSAFGKPDLVLVYAGEIDVTGNYQLAAFGERYAALLDAIRADNPGGQILAGTLVASTSSAYAPRVNQANQAIRTVVEAQSAAYGDVWLVDFSAALTPADMATSMYPRDSGYQKMAALWQEAILPLL